MFVERKRVLVVYGQSYEACRFVNRCMNTSSWVVRFFGLEISFSDKAYASIGDALEAATHCRNELLSFERLDHYVKFMPISLGFAAGKIDALLYFRIRYPHVIEFSKIGTLNETRWHQLEGVYKLDNAPNEIMAQVDLKHLGRLWLEKAMENFVTDFTPTPLPRETLTVKKRKSKPQDPQTSLDYNA